MRFPRKTGRCSGRFVLVLYLLGHALAHVSGQVASADRTLPTADSKTDENITIPLAFAQESFPDAMIDVPYESSVQAIGGSGLYELSATGDLPPGLSMETGGRTISFGGVPTTTGTYQFQVMIRDANGTSFKRDFSIQVYPRVLGAKAMASSPRASDAETVTLSDVTSVFFPAQIVDNESFKLTDTETGLDSIQILDNEAFTLTDTDSGLDAADIVDNENFSFSDTVTIAFLRTPRISWTAPAPITYGTPLSATQLDATSTTDGTFTYTPPSGTVLPAGQHTLSVTFTPSDSSVFGPATATVTITVNPATQSIAFTPPASPVIYGVSPITLVATGGASGNPVTFSILSGPGNVSGINGGTLTITGLGTVVVAANQAGNTNYSAASQVTQSIVVNAAPPAVLTSPTPGLGTTLGSPNATFQWNTVMGASDYQLNLSAVSPGASDLFLYKGTATTATATTLPAYGTEVYATLYTKISGVWASNSYVYYESGPRLAQLTSPTPGLGTILGASNVTFQWTTGAEVADYQLNLSAIGTGQSELFSYKGTATSAIVPNLPTNGATVYATLYSKINGTWQSIAYQYTESGTPTPAILTSPTPGLTTILGTSSVLFQWTAGGGASEFQLNLSAITPGASDLFVYKGTASSATVPMLPAHGVTVYATLYSKIQGTWQSNSYVYTESGSPTPAALTSPTPGLGTILGTTDVLFQWSAGTSASDYQLNLSTVAPGDSELYSYKGTALSATAPSLPANGVKVYARLYSKIDGNWLYNDYVYTEQ